MTGPQFAPSADDLAAAYAAHRRRSWPPTLEAALACPLHSRLVHLHARCRWLRLQAAQAKAARPPATPARPVPSPLPTVRDGKRLAAGDTDD